MNENLNLTITTALLQKKMAHQHQNEKQKFPFLLDALYCEEEHWEGLDKEDCFISNEEESRIDGKPPLLMEQDLFWGEEELCSLFNKEQENDLYNSLKTNPSLAGARTDAVEWMLKVTAFYSFSAPTAVLAVNYLDRFLFSFQSHNEKKLWMTQLAAVACLSLAAKVEETQVPLLLDFQVEESKYVFEAKTIQRMEILVLSTLEWKMNPVTPLSFLDFVTRRLGLKNHIYWEFLKRCEFLLLFIISDCRFMSYLPSVMATATMLHVIVSVEPCLGVEYQDQLLGILGINKDKVEECYRLISEVASAYHFHSSNKRKFRSFPGSPKGVMDLSFSSESSSNDSWSVAGASVSSSPEPLTKKSRAQAGQKEDQQQQHAQEQELDHATASDSTPG
ncbi:cyclin-D3-1 [Coffea arabica]|uniref:Cyclin-D3-1 n=1 Tax=Coffea arabica TaxID=13443 RepID=A0A6P6UTS8_COFAR|nr:cyclin-D3-1-like [Coffea arabica]